MLYQTMLSPMGVKPGYHYLRTPYVGVTGFTAPGQIGRLLDAAPAVAADPDRCLMAGVLVSEHTLEGRPCDFRNPGRYPAVDAVRDIWDERAFCTAHYCSRDNTLDVAALVDRCGLAPGMGVQLNLVWPDPGTVSEIYSRRIFTILQVSGKSLEQVDWDGKKLRSRLALYDLDYVLLDLSRGAGVPLDGPKLETLLAHLGGLRCEVVVAGGLSDESGDQWDQVRSLARYPNISSLSVDAESGVRDSSDELDYGKCLGYLEAATRALDLS